MPAEVLERPGRMQELVDMVKKAKAEEALNVVSK